MARQHYKLAFLWLSAAGLAYGQEVSCYASQGEASSPPVETQYPAFTFDDTACVSYCYDGKENYGMFSDQDVADMKQQKGIYTNVHDCHSPNCNIPGTTNCDKYLSWTEWYNDSGSYDCSGEELHMLSWKTGQCHHNLQTNKYETVSCNETAATLISYSDASCSKGAVTQNFEGAKLGCKSSGSPTLFLNWACSPMPPLPNMGISYVVARGYDDTSCSLTESNLISLQLWKNDHCFNVSTPTQPKFELYAGVGSAVKYTTYPSSKACNQRKPTSTKNKPTTCSQAVSYDPHAGNYYVYSFSANTPSPSLSPSATEGPTEQPTEPPVTDDGFITTGTHHPTPQSKASKLTPTMKPSELGPTKYPVSVMTMVTPDEAVLIGAVIGAIGFILVIIVITFIVIRRIRIHNDEKIRQWASQHQTSGEAYNQPIGNAIHNRAVSTDGIELKGVSSPQQQQHNNI